MADLNFLGLGGGTPKPIGNAGKPPSFGKFGFTKHAHKTRVTGGKVGFFNKVSNVKWDKMMQNSGRSTFKTRSGEVVKARATKKIVAEMIEKAGGQGLSGKQIKQKLVRNYGMKYKDAGDIARAATYHYYEPPPDEGISGEDRLRNVRAGRFIFEKEAEENQGMAEKLLQGRMDKKKRRGKIKETLTSEKVYKEHLGIEGEEYREYAGGEKKKVGLSDDKFSASANTPSGGQATIGQKRDEKTVGVGGSHQSTEAKKEKTATPQKSMQPAQVAHNVGTVNPPGENEPVVSQNSESQEPSGGALVGGVVDKYGNVINLNEKGKEKGNIIKEIRAREVAKKAAAENDKEEGDELPSEGVADDYEEEDIRKAA